MIRIDIRRPRVLDFGPYAAAGLALLLAACAGAPAPTAGSPAPAPAATSARGHPLGDVTIARAGAKVAGFEVEIAETPQAMGAGLMGVERLGPGEGMVFLFGQEVQSPFYMKNTLIPLDIAFWDAQGRIVEVLGMTPCTEDPCPLYQPEARYVGALEVNAGRLAKLGVQTGDTVELARRDRSASP